MFYTTNHYRIFNRTTDTKKNNDNTKCFKVYQDAHSRQKTKNDEKLIFQKHAYKCTLIKIRME